MKWRSIRRSRTCGVGSKDRREGATPNARRTVGDLSRRLRVRDDRDAAVADPGIHDATRTILVPEADQVVVLRASGRVAVLLVLEVPAEPLLACGLVRLRRRILLARVVGCPGAVDLAVLLMRGALERDAVALPSAEHEVAVVAAEAPDD